MFNKIFIKYLVCVQELSKDKNKQKESVGNGN